ncbi:hypothetical protein NIES37_63730 [Tolypothrix tenuis PCC 7101]|uniref:Uncharacterized protein n=1 Tax=Tolypothrix tenuis PCC 7101 TaxID=231146 RepID=A0A1Z4N9H7_9CYAN|nr:hypothetical protein NIES37_63730 [Tolypothrix tenuis PCC 7101]BAZ73718.1 hypothetical protein NIES50_22840 [Aulosira laxa NIES-50]
MKQPCLDKGGLRGVTVQLKSQGKTFQTTSKGLLTNTILKKNATDE